MAIGTAGRRRGFCDTRDVDATAGIQGGRELDVLVVEDDHRIASMLAKGLRTKGYAVEIVLSGAAALERVADGPVDVVLLDLGLPDIDGIDVLRELAARASTVPVIVITARSDPIDREAALELGVAAYLTKPFAWADLSAAITTCTTPVRD